MHHDESLICPLARMLYRADEIVRDVRRVDGFEEAGIRAARHFARSVEQTQNARRSFIYELDTTRVIVILDVWELDALRLVNFGLVLED